MTREAFRKRYPNGLNVIITSFQKSLYHVMTTEEIDKLVSSCKFRERLWLLKFKKYYRENVEDWCGMPIWYFLTHCKSINLINDVLTIMICSNTHCYYGEGEEIEEIK